MIRIHVNSCRRKVRLDLSFSLSLDIREASRVPGEAIVVFVCEDNSVCILIVKSTLYSWLMTIG